MTAKKPKRGLEEVKPEIKMEWADEAPRLPQVAEPPAVEPEVERLSRTYFDKRRKWPRACLLCGGDGGVMSKGREEAEISLCPACLGTGKCPRCATQLPAGWRELVENPIIMRDGKPAENIPARCEVCRWRDGDEPVLDLLDGK